MSALRYTVLLSLLLTGCANVPDSYAPPIQRKPIGSGEPPPVANFVNMGDWNAASYIVRDIADSVEAGTWRWTRKRPELRFYLDSIEQVRFKADFAVAEATMKTTGPVTITVFVNGNLLERIPCPEHGEKSIDKPVPREFLRANAMNIVAMEVDKVYVAGADGATLGFILTRAGFTQ